MKFRIRKLFALSVLALVGAAVFWALQSTNTRIAGHRSNSTDQGNDSAPLSALEQGTKAHDEDAHSEAFPLSPCDSLPASAVCFPNGATVQVIWRRPEVDTEFLPEPYARHHEDLVSRAQQGDTVAALSLHEMLGYCQSAYVSEARLNEALEILHQTHRFKTPDLPEPVLLAKPEKIPHFEANLIRDFQRCKDLEREDIDNREQWLKVAATGDSTGARLKYGSTIEDHKVALPYFESAWEMGDIEALTLMASIYRHQYNTGEVPTDNVRAYAMYLAYAQLLDATMGPRSGHGQIAARQVARVQSNLADRASELQQHEIEEAIKIAITTVEDNKACCFGL